MKYDLAIFDLDGTILNTLEDLVTSMNYALKSCGYPQRSSCEIRLFLGNGILNLAERCLPENAGIEERDRLVETFNEYYAVHCDDHTGPYEGIRELIRALRQKGMKTAVVSNKPDYGVQILCSRHFKGLFDCTAGVKEGIRRKPAPDSVLEVLRQLQIGKEKAVYIGDSEVDLETAKNAEMDCISVDWGFRDRAALVQMGASVIASDSRALQKLLIGM